MNTKNNQLKTMNSFTTLKRSATFLIGLNLIFLVANAQTLKKIVPGKTRIAILVYPDVELLDFSGPTEVFSNVDDFQTYLVSTGPAKIQTKNNSLTLTADYTIANAPQPDILVIPGAPMDPVESVYRNPEVLKWIRSVDTHTRFTMSVCTGAFILSKTGLLDHRTVTSHMAVIDSLKRFNRKSTVIKDTRYVQDGKFLTTAGISAGIDGALHLVEILKGADQAIMVSRIMQYDQWSPNRGTLIPSK